MKLLERFLVVLLSCSIIIWSINSTIFTTRVSRNYISVNGVPRPIYLDHQSHYGQIVNAGSKAIPVRLFALNEPPVNRSESRSGNQRNLTTVSHIGVVPTKSRRPIEIGVWGTDGKWYGEFVCGPGPRDNVSVIQTTDYDRISKSDVLFLLHNTGFDWERLKTNRSHGQIWIYASFESPLNAYKGQGYQDIFTNDVNWTYTYRSDATFPSPYGAYYQRNTSSLIPEKFVNRAGNKSGLVCAMISNCETNWRRMGMVREIASYIKTDIYGACGSKDCPTGPSCNQILSEYKFYLAFENSECVDYITEKFWHNALDNDIVPVVYGARPEDYERIAPPNSYIHVKNFPSIAHLTEYLHLLDRNDTLYNAYFDWKKRWHSRGNRLADYYEPSITMCRILEKFNEVEDSLYSNHSMRHSLGKPDLVESWLNSCG